MSRSYVEVASDNLLTVFCSSVRILAITLDDDPKKLLHDINRLRARIASVAMCEKIDAFVHDSREKKAIIRRYARENDVELVLCIVRGADEPRLAKYELDRVVRASKKYKSYMKSTRSPMAKANVTDPDVRLVLDLQVSHSSRRNLWRNEAEFGLDGSRRNTSKLFLVTVTQPCCALCLEKTRSPERSRSWPVRSSSC